MWHIAKCGGFFVCVFFSCKPNWFSHQYSSKLSSVSLMFVWRDDRLQCSIMGINSHNFVQTLNSSVQLLVGQLLLSFYPFISSGAVFHRADPMLCFQRVLCNVWWNRRYFQCTQWILLWWTGVHFSRCHWTWKDLKNLYDALWEPSNIGFQALYV